MTCNFTYQTESLKKTQENTSQRKFVFWHILGSVASQGDQKAIKPKDPYKLLTHHKNSSIGHISLVFLFSCIPLTLLLNLSTPMVQCHLNSHQTNYPEQHLLHHQRSPKLQDCNKNLVARTFQNFYVKNLSENRMI